MDELLEKLDTTLISQEINGETKNFESLYKNWGKLGNQEERRKELLDVQKSNRNNKLDKFRGIIELVNAVEEENLFKKNKVYYRPSIYVAGFNKASTTYNNVLMMSEWMIEKPVDFDENWFVVSCPKGVRMLVVANNGITKCFTKYGQFRFEKRTALPGGNPCDPKRRAQCCVLDCFYQENNNTMYVLDLLAWNNQPMTDGETEFRYYWLQTQLTEIPGLKTINKKNQMIFTLLPKVSCSSNELNEFMMQYPPFECNFPPRDGLLFYHKRSHYVSGQTPLVGWLFPYMVNEILGPDVTVHQMYMLEKPADYVDQADFIEKFEAKEAKRTIGRGKNDASKTDTMDTAEIVQDDNVSEETTVNKDSASMEAEEVLDRKLGKNNENLENRLEK